MKRFLYSIEGGRKTILPCLTLVLLLLLPGCNSDLEDQVHSGAGDFLTDAGDAKISGSLFLPEGAGPFPVVIIVGGSRIAPKEEDFGFNNLFLPNGYAVYHYDRRGIGLSTGNYPAESLANPFDFLNARRDDVLGIVELLSNHSDIRNDKIGLLGSSQGTWVNTLVFNATQEVDFMVMAVGGAIATGPESHYDALTADPNISIAEATERISEYDGPLGYDPVPTLRQVEIPTGFFFGGMDRSHPSFYDIPILENLNKDNFTIYLFDNADHELIDVTTGELEANLFPTLLAWLDENVN